MKSIFALLAAGMFLVSMNTTELPAQLEVGDKLPATKQAFKDVSGADLLLPDLVGENGLLIVFTCNTCPYVIAWEDRYPLIAEFAAMNKIGLVMLNPNEARRTTSDSFEAMQAHAKEAGYEFHYALDANHAFADALGATKTPDVFLFDSELTLAYKGAIDDNHKSAESVESAYLKDAIINMVNGEEIDPNATKAIGCSIKRVK